MWYCLCQNQEHIDPTSKVLVLLFFLIACFLKEKYSKTPLSPLVFVPLLFDSGNKIKLLLIASTHRYIKALLSEQQQTCISIKTSKAEITFLLLLMHSYW